MPILLAVTLLVLGRICFDPFSCWDDNLNISRNPAFLPPTLSSVAHLWTSPTVYLYIPLTYTIWAAISWATQFTDAAGHIVQVPWAFHLASLLAHLVTTLLVYRFLLRLKLQPLSCFCGAILFAIHPVQVETVAWASGLRDLLACAFSIAAMDQYLIYARDNGNREGRSHYQIACVLFVAAVLCKTTAMILPGCVVLLDRLVVGRSWRAVLAAAGPWLLVTLPAALLVRALQQTDHVVHISVWARPLIAGDAITFYLEKLLVPVRLAIDYGRTPAAVLAQANCYWEWIIPACLAVILFLNRRRYPLLALAAGIFTIGLLPVLGLTEFLFQYLSTTADHYLYFSMLGCAIALGSLLDAVPNRGLQTATFLLLAAMGVISFRQAGYWHDEQTLWTRQIELNPRSYVSYTNLGISQTQVQDYPAAVDAFARAVELRPDEDIPRNDLANALHDAGRLDEAIDAKKQAVEIERDAPKLDANWIRHAAELGAFLCEAGRYAEAIPYLQTAHSIAPADAKVNALLRRAATRAATTQH